jgi:aspartyl-tRNA(Asn)/glutamyl-tRNA(Gln) amidotransferase subunit C
MSLSQQEVMKIAHLARLSLQENQVQSYAEKLSGVMALVEQMQQVHTDDVLPLSHPLEAMQRLREDVVTETNQREALMANAPKTEEGLFLVPKVIE